MVISDNPWVMGCTAVEWYCMAHGPWDLITSVPLMTHAKKVAEPCDLQLAFFFYELLVYHTMSDHVTSPE
jgi:hypothetical protein